MIIQTVLLFIILLLHTNITIIQCHISHNHPLPTTYKPTTTATTTTMSNTTLIPNASSTAATTTTDTTNGMVHPTSITKEQNHQQQQCTNYGDNNNNNEISLLLQQLQQTYYYQPMYIQAVQEMIYSIQDLIQPTTTSVDMTNNNNNDSSSTTIHMYRQALRLLLEPERIISFRINWVDDHGQIQINRGWRIEYNSALGPYKGGLRFHPNVDEGILKFLAFEQTFKNALTGLPLGGGKGGSDFNPKGKSNHEIQRFCQSYMMELYRHIHPSTDVPAGDMGVGTREIGYLYGQYKRLTNRHGDHGVLTGKSNHIGGIPLRPEATGYGLIYMTQMAIRHQWNCTISDMRYALSGSGNVAQYAAQKLLQLGGKVVTMSDSHGTLIFDNGMTQHDLDQIMTCKNIHRGQLSSIQNNVSGTYVSGISPWMHIPNILYDIALPCATENEITADSAERMTTYGVKGIIEGANLPTNLDAQDIFRRANVLYIPGKASNAGGVGVSGLEMSQNAQRLIWTADTVDAKLQEMMSNIYHQMIHQQQQSSGSVTLEQGANRAGFIKVANAMNDLGWL